MKRLAFLTRLALPSAPPPRRTNDGTPGNWFPLRRYRLWDKGKQSRLSAGNPSVPKVVMSYQSRQAADDAALKMAQTVPESTFEVQDAGTDTLECINHFTGEIRVVTAGEWQSRWPRILLPEPDPLPAQASQSGKGAALEHAA